MALEISREYYDALAYDLDAEIASYTQALEDHKSTVDVPAPTTDALVETIVKQYDGQYTIIEPPTPPELPEPKPGPRDDAEAEWKAMVVTRLEALEAGVQVLETHVMALETRVIALEAP